MKKFVVIALVLAMGIVSATIVQAADTEYICVCKWGKLIEESKTLTYKVSSIKKYHLYSYGINNGRFDSLIKTEDETTPSSGLSLLPPWYLSNYYWLDFQSNNQVIGHKAAVVMIIAL